MKHKKRPAHGFKNPMPGLFWAFLLLCIAAAIALLVYAYNPAVGPHPLTGTIDEIAYSFNQLSLSRPWFSLTMDHGYIVPVLADGEICGLYLIGLGTYRFSPPPDLATIMEADIGHAVIEDTFDSVFISANHQSFVDILYDTGAIELSDSSLVQRAADLLDEDRTQIGTALPIEHTRLLTFNPKEFYALIRGHRLAQVDYSEGSDITIRFLTLGGKEVTMANPDETTTALVSGPARPSLKPASLLVFGSNLLILFLLTYILTLDLQHPDTPTRLQAVKLDLAVFAIGLVFMEATFWLVAPRIGLTASDLYVLIGVFILLIGCFLARHRISPAAVGLTTIHLGRALLVGLFLGLLAPVAVTLSYPRSLEIASFTELLHIAGPTLLMSGFLHSLYLHGFLQTSLQRLIGGPAGLLITAIIATVVPHIDLLLQWSPDQGLLVLQPLITSLITILFAGYLYMRTGNIAGVVVLRTLLETAPRLFQF